MVPIGIMIFKLDMPRFLSIFYFQILFRELILIYNKLVIEIICATIYWDPLPRPPFALEFWLPRKLFDCWL